MLKILFVVLFSSVAMAQVLPVRAGGTGQATLPAHAPLVGNGTAPLTAINPGIAGQCLISGGPSVDPVFAACPAGAGGGNVSNVTTPAAPTVHQVPVWQSATTISGVGPGTAGQVLTSNGASADPSWQAPLTTGLTSLNNSTVPAQQIQGASGITVNTVTGTGITTITPAYLPLNLLIQAAAPNTFASGNNTQTWRWALTGTAPTYGFRIGEGVASTNSNASSILMEVQTLTGSTISPFQAAVQTGTVGMKIATDGNITAIGGAKFIGPVRLPAGLANQNCLGTGAQGDIEAGTCGGAGPGGTAPVYPKVFPHLEMLTTANTTITNGVTDQPECDNFGNCTMATPSTSGMYRVEFYISQVTPGGSGCTGGTGAVHLTYTDGISNVTVTWAAIPIRPMNSNTVSLTFALAAGANASNTIFMSNPMIFYARGDGASPIRYRIYQTAAITGCPGTPPAVPVFSLRIALFGPLGY